MREENIAKIREFAGWLSANREEANRQAAEMLALAPEGWEGWLAAHSDARTLHFLQALLAVAEVRRDRAEPIGQFVLRHAGEVYLPEFAEPVRERIRVHARGALRPEPEGLIEPVGAALAPDHHGIVARLLSETPSGDWPALAEHDELHTVSALDQLSRQAVARIHRAPLESLAIARLALGILDRLPASLYAEKLLGQLRAQIWKDQANALRFLGRYGEAFAAYDRAEENLDALGVFDSTRAVVWLGRSAALQEAGRIDESMPLIRECKRIFEQSGDRRGLLFCGISEGALLHRLARYREACDVYLALIPLAQQIGDRDALASIHNNIGHSAIEIEQFALADDHLAKAATLFREIQEPLQLARAELAQGRMFLRLGETERGMAQLHRVREDFLAHDLVEEAGLCGLDLVEAHLSRGASDEAEELARELVSEFTAAGLNTRAITALAYLSDAIAQRKASGATVQNVRRFIRRLRSDPDTEFVAA